MHKNGCSANNVQILIQTAACSVLFLHTLSCSKYHISFSLIKKKKDYIPTARVEGYVFLLSFFSYSRFSAAEKKNDYIPTVRVVGYPYFFNSSQIAAIFENYEVIKVAKRGDHALVTFSNAFHAVGAMADFHGFSVDGRHILGMYALDERLARQAARTRMISNSELPRLPFF